MWNVAFIQETIPIFKLSFDNLISPWTSDYLFIEDYLDNCDYS